MRFRAALLLVAAGCVSAQTDRDWLNRGVQAFKSARYADAADAFQRAVELNPSSVPAHLYLGTAYMQQYIPGAESSENSANADKAQAEFQRVLDLDSGNKVALASIASLDLNRKRFDDARDAYKRLLAVDPNNREAYYSLAFIAWSQWYPAYSKTRQELGMRPEDPGPIADAAVRTRLRSQWWTVLDEGIWNLNRALELDPEYADAMAYMNLFVRERADLRDTKQEYQQDVADADQWVQKALAAKMAQAARMQSPMVAPPPPPPPPPGGSGRGDRIRVGSVQMAKLLVKPNPVYPPLALQAKIQGTVKFTIIIGKDGRPTNIQVESGHPLLVPAALDAVKQYVYQPTLLNGEPTEVSAQVEVDFVLPVQ
jgi:TonB family protein